MNIFLLDSNPKIAAQYHNDKHCVKMILETAQLLSTAHRVLDKECLESNFDTVLYKATHINHPSAKWVRECQNNYYWTYNLFLELLSEYTYRYEKKHKCVFLIDILCNFPKNLKNVNGTLPYLCMPDECKVSDAIQSYRNYYVMHKQHLASWKKRGEPFWWSNECQPIYFDTPN